MQRITRRITQTLGPFAPQEILVYDPRKGFSSFEQVQNKRGKFRTIPATKPGFLAQLWAGLPRSLQHRFRILDDYGPAPTSREYLKLEREILGYARRKLMHELVSRITELPSRPGRKGGRGRPIEYESNERRQIQERVRELMRVGDYGEPMSKRKACKAVAATEGGPSERHIWRIVAGH